MAIFSIYTGRTRIRKGSLVQKIIVIIFIIGIVIIVKLIILLLITIIITIMRVSRGRTCIRKGGRAVKKEHTCSQNLNFQLD